VIMASLTLLGAIHVVQLGDSNQNWWEKLRQKLRNSKNKLTWKTTKFERKHQVGWSL
jgi:hypothetical protein